MNRDDINFIGTGIYSVPEASRLTKVSQQRIRRWLSGYKFRSVGRQLESLPVWSPQLPRVDGKLALGFLDLLEVRFVDAFLSKGVTWKALRRAAERARELFGVSHPFTTQRFRTDGISIFADLVNEYGDNSLLELTQSQHYFRKVISPYLQDVDFHEKQPARRWPMTNKREVVIDPSRSFGQPIVPKRGVPTAVLYTAHLSMGSIKEVCRWYEVEAKEVRHAKSFEEKFSVAA